MLANNESRCICDYTLGQLFYEKDFDLDSLKNIKYNSLIEEKLNEIVEKNNFSKYFKYLPQELKREVYLERFCDFEGLNDFLKNISIIEYV